MIEFVIQKLRKYDDGHMTKQEVRDFLMYAVNSGLVWTFPGILAIGRGMKDAMGN